jgi:hypothetical protein
MKGGRHDVLHRGTIPPFAGGVEEMSENPTAVKATNQRRLKLNLKHE